MYTAKQHKADRRQQDGKAAGKREVQTNKGKNWKKEKQKSDKGKRTRHDDRSARVTQYKETEM